jgi:L-threonylcarbamoyladenylate synthase
MRVIREDQNDSISLALEFLHAKKIIAFACDTIYGIACDASDEKAVEALYKIKNRDLKKPIAIFLKDLKAANEIFYFDEVSKKIADKFLPGAITLVLKPKKEAALKLARNLNNSDEFLGFRIVDKSFIQKLLNEFNGILAVTSANISNKTAANSVAEIINYFKNDDILIIDDNSSSKLGKPSTVIKIADQKIEILREGIISENQIKDL